MIGQEPRKWIDLHFQDGSTPPFSFLYSGKPLDKAIAKWGIRREPVASDNGQEGVRVTYSDPKTKLRIVVECKWFRDETGLDLYTTLENGGAADTPGIESFQVFDAAIIEALQGNCVLHRALGSSASRSDFAPITDEMTPGKAVEMFTLGGRSSNSTALPFFNIEDQGRGGIIVAVGWSGLWAATIRNESGAIRLRVGMDVANFKLHPGEKVRMPRLLLFGWEGTERIAGHNKFRRFLLDHYIPKYNGVTMHMPLACSGCRGQKLGDESNNFTEENQIEFIEEFAKYKPECHWIDAGWFDGRWPNGVGSWTPRKDGFPRGLRPIADAARKHDMGFVLWFEPERVHDGSWLHQHHPEWLLSVPGGKDHLLDLGNDEAREWLTDHISGLITASGITVYRQDFNFDPAAFWELADEKGREGITEIRHVEGLYRFWDDLRKRHPGLVIDNCASGGRRLDLETISRSVALWRSDYQYFEPVGQQCHTYGINYYIPTTSTGNKKPSPYEFRSAMTNGLVLGWELLEPDFPAEHTIQLSEEFKRVRSLYLGDYYPLTAYSTADDAWMAYQFHRDDLKTGMVLAFRREKATTLALTVKPAALKAGTMYKVEWVDQGRSEARDGKVLAKGIKILLPSAPSSALILYTW
jgi:alpha-galactosidase